MTINIAEELKGLTPEQQEERMKDWWDLIDAEVDVLEELNPQMADELIVNLVTKLPPERRKKIMELLSQPKQESQSPQ